MTTSPYFDNLTLDVFDMQCASVTCLYSVLEDFHVSIEVQTHFYFSDFHLFCSIYAKLVLFCGSTGTLNSPMTSQVWSD